MRSVCACRWIDAEGDVMAESLHWALGNTEVHESGRHQAIASEGWLVLASAKGWEKIKPMLGNFVRHRMAGRETGFERDGSRKLKVEKEEKPLL